MAKPKSSTGRGEDPCNHGQDRGHVVPPVRPLKERWEELNGQVNGSQSSAAYKAYTQFMGELKGDPGFSAARPRPIKIPNASPQAEPDATEPYSRVFRYAIKLSSRYEITSSDGEFASRPADWVQVNDLSSSVWSADVPDATEVKAAVGELIAMGIIEPAPDDEMCLQDRHPDVFMLWGSLDVDADPEKYPYTCMVLDTVNLALAFVVYETKARARVDRPARVNNKVKYSLKVPGHSSWPAGHAFIGGTMAVLLSSLQTKPDLPKIWAAAYRLGHNRMRGGLHTTLDIEAGLDQGARTAMALLAASRRAAKKKAPKDSTEERLTKLWELFQYARNEWH